MIISPTNAKREVDIIDWLIEQAESDDESNVSLRLKRFEGKHFRGLDSEELLEVVTDISNKFIKRKLINDFSHEYDGITPSLRLTFDIKDKKVFLEQYRQDLLYKIGKAELQNVLKKGNYAWLDEETKTFYFKLPNGSIKSISLWTTRATSDQLFLIFRVLYKHWYKSHEQVISKSNIKIELSKLGWEDATDSDIKNYIKNLRDTKIKPAELDTFIRISYDIKQKGYKIVVGYP